MRVLTAQYARNRNDMLYQALQKSWLKEMMFPIDSFRHKSWGFNLMRYTAYCFAPRILSRTYHMSFGVYTFSLWFVFSQGSRKFSLRAHVQIILAPRRGHLHRTNLGREQLPLDGTLSWTCTY